MGAVAKVIFLWGSACSRATVFLALFLDWISHQGTINTRVAQRFWDTCLNYLITMLTPNVLFYSLLCFAKVLYPGLSTLIRFLCQNLKYWRDVGVGGAS